MSSIYDDDNYDSAYCDVMGFFFYYCIKLCGWNMKKSDSTDAMMGVTSKFSREVHNFQPKYNFFVFGQKAKKAAIFRLLRQN